MYDYLIGREVTYYTERIVYQTMTGNIVDTYKKPFKMGTGRVTLVDPLRGITVHDDEGRCIHTLAPWTRSRGAHRIWLSEWYSQLAGMFRGVVVMPATYGYDNYHMQDRCRSIHA